LCGTLLSNKILGFRSRVAADRVERLADYEAGIQQKQRVCRDAPMSIVLLLSSGNDGQHAARSSTGGTG